MKKILITISTLVVLACATTWLFATDASDLKFRFGITATPAEINVLDGITATVAELNIMDGVTSTAAELNIMDGVTSTAAELNILDGVTATYAEINALDGISMENNFELPLNSAFIVGVGIMGNDATTAPGVATTDNVPAIVWATSEVTKIQWTFRVPADYSSGMGFRVLISSDQASGALVGADFQVYTNVDGSAFDAAATAETAVRGTEAALDTKNELITLLIANSTLAAGNWVTVDIWPDVADNTLEIKSVQAYYTGAL